MEAEALRLASLLVTIGLIYSGVIYALCVCIEKLDDLERRRLEAKRLPRARSLER